MAEYKTLNEAMLAKDELAEAEIRYRLLAEAFEAMPQLRANSGDSGKVVEFDATRFRKATG